MKNKGYYGKTLVISIILIVFLFSSTYGFSESNYSLGDVNDDGKINIKDAALVHQHIVAIITLKDKQFKAADINKDGEVNIVDLSHIMKFVLGHISDIQAPVQSPADYVYNETNGSSPNDYVYSGADNGSPANQVYN